MAATAPNGLRRMGERSALITGANGQDGRLLTRHLLARGYRVTGTSRHAKPGDRSVEGIDLRRCGLTSQDEVNDLIAEIRPDEIYNFAAFSTGSGMFDDPVAMGDVNGQGPVRILEAIRTIAPATRFCQASSSEMFGARSPAPQSAETRLDPRSPYGAAKQYAHAMIDAFRDRHGIFACSAILFNHESELRPTSFVTRKITRAAARIEAGLDDHVMLGDLDARRDWGYAGDYVAAAWTMLQAERPADYVVATGHTHSVRDFARTAFDIVGLDYQQYVRLDPRFSRPRAGVELVGDPSALKALGWAPSVSFHELVRRMVEADVMDLDILTTSRED